MAKERIDTLLVARGLVETRQRAKALIMAGQVLANGQKINKAGAQVEATAVIRLLGMDCPFVSRGGIKLDHALRHFHISVEGTVCLDLGSSTGGFTDCLLQWGATRVYCVDVGRGQLHWRLRTDSRVTLLEGYNARKLSADDFPRVSFQIVTMDLAFISQRLIFPPLYTLLSSCGNSVEIVTLVKPQFEAGRSDVGKGGVVKDETVHQRVLTEIAAAAVAAGFIVGGNIPSPITGADGNIEFLQHLRFQVPPPTRQVEEVRQI